MQGEISKYQTGRRGIFTREKARANREKKLTIGNDYCCIDEGAFRNNIKIRSLVLDESIYEIRSHAFSNCTAIKHIEMPGIRLVGQNAFEGCVNLGKAELGETVERLGKSAFCGCKRLKEVSFGEKSACKIIHQNTFSECQSLETLKLPGGTVNIQEKAFYHCGIRELILSEGLVQIGDSAFLKCRNLEYVKIPASVKRIEKWAFHGCDRLKVLEIPEDPEYIGNWIVNRSVTVRCRKGGKVDEYCQEFQFKTEYI